MPTQDNNSEDSDDQEKDDSSSEYYSPQLECTSTFTPASIMATETVLSTPDVFNLDSTARRCECGALIKHDDTISHGIISSHNISTSGYHLELDEWLNDLTKAINAAWPRRHVTYSHGHVLMITWGETDMPSMGKEVKRLSSVFSDVFGYEIHPLIIPTSKADLIVRRKVDDFIEGYGQQDNLLIVYYAGHAKPGLHSGAPPIWYPKNPIEGESRISFDTNNIQPILARAQDDSPDVLLIYDCCYSLSSHPTNDKPSRAIVECLFAGGFETKVPIAGPDSFTSALIHELCGVGNSLTPLSVTDLHRKIIDRLQSWKSHGVFNQDGTIMKDKKTKKIVMTKPVRTTPIHMFLSENESPRTIFLSPKKQQGLDTTEVQRNGDDQCGNVEYAKPPRVLLAVRLTENDYNAEALKNWILTAPHGVVKFEKIYQSYSELLLVELPLQVWDLLPRNPAVTFIGFTKGEISIQRPATDTGSAPAATSDLQSSKMRDLGKGQSSEIRLPNSLGTNQNPAKVQSLNLADYPNSHIYNPETKEDRGLVTVLGAVDRALPEIFTNLEKNGNQNEFQLKYLFGRVLENLAELEVPREDERFPEDGISQYEAFLFQYISAKHLIRYGPSWLNVENRLTGPIARMYNWYNDDARADSASISEIGAHEETSSRPSTNHSKFWSSPSTGGGSSGIAPSMLDSTPDISIETVLEKRPPNGNELSREVAEEKMGPDLGSDLRKAQSLEGSPDISALQSHKEGVIDHRPDNGHEEERIGRTWDTEGPPHHNPKPNLYDEGIEHNTTVPLGNDPEDEENMPRSEVQQARVSNVQEQQKKGHRKEEDSSMVYGDKSLVEMVENEQFPAIINRDKVVSFDLQLKYLSEDSDSESESESESSEPSRSLSPTAGQLQDSTETGDEYPTIKSRHAAIDDPMETASVKSYVYPNSLTERVDVGDPRSFLDARYRVHKHSDFQPGRVFKILWSERTGGESLGVKPRSGSKFYVGIRRFIIIATDEEGHSTCVPILTYERRGCTKSGVNPKTHGIVYSVSGNSGEREPRLLKGEPELGFPPIKVDGYRDDDPLPKESRVNYAKLITIEHNVKVFFIGFIPLLDFEKVVLATNECWEKNMRKGR